MSAFLYEHEQRYHSKVDRNRQIFKKGDFYECPMHAVARKFKNLDELRQHLLFICAMKDIAFLGYFHFD